MFDQSEFRELVSGRRHGAAASVLRGLLSAVEVPYSLAVRWRNRRFDLGRAAVHRVNVPVVSVGNLTLGGTGKTPMVKWIARWASEYGLRAVIVSRGYGAAIGDQNDEARELAQALPGVPHVQNPDRVAAARQAVDQFSAELVVLDDGFQHRRLARDLNIVLLDALEPFGFDHVFPRGMLREPVTGLARADVVCLGRADLVTPQDRADIRERVTGLAPRAAWCEAVHAPNQLVNSAGQAQALESLCGRRVAAFCGLGNPVGFRRTLETTGCEIVAWREFPDHHTFSSTDLDALDRAAGKAGADLLVCTHKDLVKIASERLGDRPLWAVTVELQFMIGEKEIQSALERVAM
jgi:tetraacyldisaccharide 4'-kinase